MTIKDVSIDYESFGDDVDDDLIREWIADEYSEEETLAVNTAEDGIVLTKGTRRTPKESEDGGKS